MWLHETLLLAATILPHEYFPSCLKACNYCSILHAIIAHETTLLVVYLRISGIYHCNRFVHSLNCNSDVLNVLILWVTITWLLVAWQYMDHKCSLCLFFQHLSRNSANICLNGIATWPGYRSIAQSVEHHFGIKCHSVITIIADISRQQTVKLLIMTSFCLTVLQWGWLFWNT